MSDGPAPAPRLGAIAALLAGSVLLSRVLGYGRDLVLANQVGAGAEADAYFVAFQIPDILNYLLAGGAFSIGFLPVYTRLRSERGEEAAQRLFHTVLGTLGLVVVLATLGLWLYADRLIALQFPSFDAETHALAVRLTRIVLPGQIFFVTGGIVRAVLMARGRFATQALAPILYNLAIMAGGLLTGDVDGFAWGVLVGAVVGPWLAPLLDLARSERIRLRIAPLDLDFRHYLWVALPLMLGLSLATVDEWYDKWLGAGLGPGTVAYLGFARRLAQVPIGVVGQAIGAAALPTLSQLWASGRREELEHTLLRTLQASLAVSLLAATACLALAEPLVEIVWRHGRFTQEAAQNVAAIFGVFALGIPGWVTQQVAVRAFFAREDTWRPMILGSAFALSAIPLYLLMREEWGARGLAGAGALAMTANALATLLWARARHGAPDLAALASTAARATAIAAVAWLAADFVQLGQPGRTGAFVDLALGGSAIAVVALLGVRVLGDEAMREAGRGLIARLRRARPRDGA